MTATVVHSGIQRGLVEWRQAFGGAALIGQMFWPVATLVAMFLLRDRTIAGGTQLGTFMLPSVLGMFVAFGMMLVIQYLAADREDGTLLRAKIIPGGIQGYFIGKLVTVSGSVLAYLAVLLIPGAFLVGGLTLDSTSVLILAWVVPLGFVATQSIGAMLGSLISGPRGAGYISLPVMGLIAISGIFYPITAMPDWLQPIAQIFPVYWLGLGMRSAMLPADAVAAEIGESWRHWETAAVLGGWAIVGLVVAPIVLRRMARRESGSRVAARREQLLARTA
ncbi:ABC transporter permease [Nocardia uniformis]|uniref:ABC transporter permease n=1 Tax=Nocardia uniformis TaxID=53432 RepID=A0A849BRJ4_9NOCA|nr:ABC transporter permease [Nocardia uniformis]NNH69243.1 ABC transporter permease [Nocardia uniformis]